MTTQPFFRFKPRNYLHFDFQVSRASAESLACDPLQVARHSFYPFLGYKITTRRIRRAEDGTIVPRPKIREIKIAAHRDAAIYAHYADLLAPSYEAELERRGLANAVTAFRRLPSGGTNIDFAGHVFRYIDNHRPCIALALDIEKFFDTLDHGLLKQQWVRLLGEPQLPPDHFAVFRSLTRFCWVDRDETFARFGISCHNPRANGRRRICLPAEFREKIRESGLLRFNPFAGKGIPQGSPISALLSNAYLLDFDEELNNAVGTLGGFYRRYCDDIIIVIPPEHLEAAEDLVAAAVRAVELTVNADKTDRVSFPIGEGQRVAMPSVATGFSDHIQYLGFTYDGSRILIRPGSLGRYYGKMRAAVDLAKQTRRKHNRKERAKGHPLSPLRVRKLHIQYSYLINRPTALPDRDRKAQGNFLTYSYRAAEKLNAPEIKRQVRNHWRKLKEEIDSPDP
jgi:RNA-directed DNA polymerase